MFALNYQKLADMTSINLWAHQKRSWRKAPFLPPCVLLLYLNIYTLHIPAPTGLKLKLFDFACVKKTKSSKSIIFLKVLHDHNPKLLSSLLDGA